MPVAQYKKEMQTELLNILQYWLDHAIDQKNSGFCGSIDKDNLPNPTADKGAVLNARILWTFSIAFQHTGKRKYLDAAQRAWEYIDCHFWDRTYGGLYWCVDYRGKPLDSKKQIYAQAFAIYAFSEYYKIVPDEHIKEKATALYHYIQQHSYDDREGGYLEAFTRQWHDIDDMRLSDKDENEKKTMNTHLHILEAYTNLYRIWGDQALKRHILKLLDVFYEKIIDQQSGHLQLFFDEQWQSKSDMVSYGHDIEASWLLLEAAEVIKEDELMKRFESLAIQMVGAVREGMDEAGGLWYEKKDGRLIREKHWWVQAEAMVGFMNAYRLSGNEHYKVLSYAVWTFVQQHIRSSKGEWLWGVDGNHQALAVVEKVGFWKCPYHNVRACIEVMKRLES